MNKASLIFASIFATTFVGGVSQAAQIACAGDYFGYHFALKTNSTKTRISGPIRVQVTNATTNQTSVLQPTSSDIRLGQYMQFMGQGTDGNGSLSATFDAGSNRYRGTLSAQTRAGNANVPVICAVQGKSFFEEQIDLESVE